MTVPDFTWRWALNFYTWSIYTFFLNLFFKTLWIIFNHLKLWIVSTRHNFKWGNIPIIWFWNWLFVLSQSSKLRFQNILDKKPIEPPPPHPERMLLSALYKLLCFDTQPSWGMPFATYIYMTTEWRTLISLSHHVTLSFGHRQTTTIWYVNVDPYMIQYRYFILTDRKAIPF